MSFWRSGGARVAWFSRLVSGRVILNSQSPSARALPRGSKTNSISASGAKRHLSSTPAGIAAMRDSSHVGSFGRTIRLTVLGSADNAVISFSFYGYRDAGDYHIFGLWSRSD